MTSHVNYDRRALERRAENKWRNIPAQVAEVRPSKFKMIVAYGVVAAGVAVAAFYVTPSHAADKTSSIIYLGEKAKFDMRVNERKASNQMAVDNNRLYNQLQLEDAKSLHARQLEEDKAYHKKLEWQRKNGK
jgi:type IV secretory pathway VirB10-like protein